MATATRSLNFNRQTSEPIDIPAPRLAYAFENVGSINVNNAERPFLSSADGMTYTVFFDDNPSVPLCYSYLAVMEFFRLDAIQVVFAGYWYKNGLVYRYDEKGNDTRDYTNFKKRLAKTDQLLIQMFEQAQSAKVGAEPKVVEVAVPTVDWRSIFRTAAYSAFVGYVLAIVSSVILFAAN